MKVQKILVVAALIASLSSFAYTVKVTNLSASTDYDQSGRGILRGLDDWAILVPIAQATGAEDKIGALLPWGATVELDLPNAAANQPLYFLLSSSEIPKRAAFIQKFLSEGSKAFSREDLSIFQVLDTSIIKVPGVAADRDLVMIPDSPIGRHSEQAIVNRSDLITKIKAWLKAKAPEYYNPTDPSYARFSSTAYMNRFNNYLKTRGLAPIPNK